MACKSDKTDFSTNVSLEQVVRKKYTVQTCRLATWLLNITLVIVLLIGIIVTVIFKTEVAGLWQQLASLKQQVNNQADSESELSGNKFMLILGIAFC